MPRQSILAMKVAFGMRAQYSNVLAATAFMVFQLIGVLIFAGNAQAATLTYNRQIATAQVGGPRDMAKDYLGNVYVADPAKHMIRKYSDAGDLLAEWGSLGSGNGQFGATSPARVAVNGAGMVYAIDADNNRVEIFNSNGEYQRQFGGIGSDDGQFYFDDNYSYGSGGIAVDSNDYVYVADAGNSRVQVFDDADGYVRQFGSYGGGNGQFYTMNGIVVGAAGKTYVSEGWSASDARVQIFDSAGVYQSQITEGSFVKPSGMDIDADGNLYVADDAAAVFNKFDSSNNFDTVWGNDSGSYTQDVVLADGTDIYTIDGQDIYPLPEDSPFPPAFAKRVNILGDTQYTFANWYDAVLDLPTDVAVASDGTTYVVSNHADRVQVYNSSGSFVRMFGQPGSGNGQFDSPRAIAVASDGSVYVVDTFNARIQKFDATGNYVTQWGSSGSGNGQFDGLEDIAIDSTGNVYSLESQNNRIQKFDATGNYVTQWGSSGSGNGQFNHPLGIAIGPADTMYVADTDNGRIQIFNSAGVYQTAKNGLSDPRSLVVDGAGSIFVASGTHNLLRLKSDLTELNTITSAGSGNGQLDYYNETYGTTAGGLAIDASHHLYVAEAGNDRVQVFDYSAYTGSPDLTVDLNVTSSVVSTTQSSATIKLTTNDNADVLADSYGVYYGVNNASEHTSSLQAASFVQTGTIGLQNTGTNNGQTIVSLGMTRDAAGNTYVTDGGSCRIQKFSPLGVYQTSIGGCGSNPGQFVNNIGPLDVVVDSGGNIYGSQGDGSHLIQKFDSAGNYLLTFTSNPAIGCSMGGHANGLAIDGNDTIYMWDRFQIQKFNTSGVCTQVWSIDSSFANTIATLSVDKNGNLFIASVSGGLIYAYTPDGELMGTFGANGSGDGQFTVAYGLAVDANNVVYVGDLAPNSGNFRIQLFDAAGTYRNKIQLPVGSASYGITGLHVDADGLVTATVAQVPGSDLYVGYQWRRQAQVTLSDLTCGTTYHYKTRAETTGGTQVGGDQTFSTAACSDSFSITTSSLPGGVVGSGYSQTIQDSSAAATTYSKTAGSLPPGLSLSASGVISGTPTTAGTYNFTVQANNGTSTASKSLQIVVTKATTSPTLTITTTSLPDATINSEYGQLIHTDATSGVSFSVVAGSLPPGLSLLDDGTISGTPTDLGDYSFTIKAQKGSASDVADLSITVVEAPVVAPDQTPTTTTSPLLPAANNPSPISAAQQNNTVTSALFALAKRIPEPVAIGFPWLLLLLALILVSIQYYQVHSESVVTKRMRLALEHQKQLTEEQQNFVALTTHYLHTPLTVLEGEISLMVKAGTLTQAEANKLKATLADLAAASESIIKKEEQG